MTSQPPPSSAAAASSDLLPPTSAADQHEKDRDYVVVEIWDTKWNNRLEGGAYIPLKQLKRRGHMKGKWRLQGGDSPEGRVSEFVCAISYSKEWHLQWPGHPSELFLGTG